MPGFAELDETIRRNTRLVQALLDKSHDGVTLVKSEMTTSWMKVHSVLGNQRSRSGGALRARVYPSRRSGARPGSVSDFADNPAKQFLTNAACWTGRPVALGWKWKSTDMLTIPISKPSFSTTGASSKNESDAAAQGRNSFRASPAIPTRRDSPQRSFYGSIGRSAREWRLKGPRVPLGRVVVPSVRACDNCAAVSSRAPVISAPRKSAANNLAPPNRTLRSSARPRSAPLNCASRKSTSLSTARSN